ncbi:sarcosine oxidase subunit gamma [Agrobacterium vitis]|uniref:sarcosine oxidase subunit gamma n=1 Tax=Agrobacterium vitis TaxID=373 RepID=UPI000872F624|nr:sarcosine oxidase subunit gamma [Agrobacterium vitis]MCE6074360.1 sarcosine oxidase subunit gamma family protein [Agrobacterium vitis]MCM2470723.1 sarcosine oxidase subunit gamma family protein [Agrobacterium vitis]MUO71020.1 sarcosine oxidase subunit gamma family protein [Agrobacterium vitis]MUO86968.1 sarcosine oxidase subunit gamma family protein [Agrobacterium vitis]MVA35816.1 sarcosine oxidase subunit gamma family protein [Agrobacterium vitis]
MVETITSGAMSATRKSVLDGAYGGSAHVTLTPAAPASRLSLRAGADAASGLSSALGLPLPTAPKTSAHAGPRLAFWLGPDEWLVIDEDGADLTGTCAASGTIHSATDVSHRNTAILVSGPGAVKTLNTACPLDLSLKTFPLGAVTRTVFGKIEIVLYRMSEDAFRVECWRSFAEYAFGMLQEGAADAA